MMSKDWLANFYDASREIDYIKYNLRGIASALSRVGMQELANEIKEYSEILGQANNTMTTAVGQHLHEECENGRKRVGEIFSAVLSSCDKDANKSKLQTVGNTATAGR